MPDDPETRDRPRKGDRDARKSSAARRSFSRFLVFLTMLLLLVPVLWSSESGSSLSYSEFKALLTAHKVDKLVIGGDRITGVMTMDGIGSSLTRERADALRKAAASSPRHPFHTVRVEDPKLVEELHAAGVEYAGRAESGWIYSMLSWLGPLLLLFLFWTMMWRRAGAASGVMAIGKSQAKIYMERSTGVTFNDVAGIDEARSELMEIVDFLKNPGRYRRLGGKIPKGVLLLGAPGTGKTLLAKALAGEARVPFFSLSGSDFVELFVGVGAARVRDLFVQAQEHAPSIIFIDELDALGRSRSVASLVGGHEEREQTLNQLLAQMDGFDTQKGVIILAATNRPEILDPALTRPGRFDRKVVLDRPDAKGREQILRVHTRSVVLAPDVDLAGLASRTPGLVGADLANLVNEAALAAARGEKGAVEAVDFENAIDRVMAGLERKSRLISPKERVIVAHHEAGHALVAERRPNADRVARVSIIPRGIAALGYTRQQPSEDRVLLTRSELLDRLDVLLGGRVAEEIVFGDVSTGAHDDLQHATDLARDMVARFGMSDAIGLAAYELPKQAMFAEAPIGRSFEYSEETARLIDAEVRRLLNAAQERVRATLTGERAALERVATLLMEREVIDRTTLLEAIGQRPAIVAA